jgi:hypothetical protein
MLSLLRARDSAPSDGLNKNYLKIIFLISFFKVGWHHHHHYTFPEHQIYASSTPTIYQQQPDSTSSHQIASEVVYFNNSTDSSDYVTTTSNSNVTPTPPTATAHQQLQSNSLNSPMNFQQRRGSLQLWQFLIALLDEPASKYAFKFLC